MSATTQIRELVADALGLEADDVPATASMQSLPDWDSLQHLSVVTVLEAELGWSLTPDEVSALTSVAAIVARLEAAP